MQKIRKYLLFKMLELFEKEFNCITIEDIRTLVNENVKCDNEVVFQWYNNKNSQNSH